MNILAYRLARLIASRELAIKSLHVHAGKNGVKLRVKKGQRVELIKRIIERLVGEGKNFKWTLDVEGPLTRVILTHKHQPGHKIELAMHPFRPADINHVAIKFKGSQQAELNQKLARHLKRALR